LATSLSADGRHVLAILPKDPPELVVLPTGPGEPERVVTDPVLAVEWATWLPAGGGMLLVGSARGGGPQLWRLDRPGPARRLAADPVASRFAGAVASPDGRRVAAATADGGVLLCPADGTPATRLAGEARDHVPVRWGPDGRSLLAFALDGPYAHLVRLDTSTGAAIPVRDLRPVDPAGVIGIPTVRTSADGTTWLYSYARLLSALYLVDGLK
jgi:Tol biopolymer transport system component